MNDSMQNFLTALEKQLKKNQEKTVIDKLLLIQKEENMKRKAHKFIKERTAIDP